MRQIKEPDSGLDKPITYSGWKDGLDTLRADHDIAITALRNAVNVDISNSGKVRRREGATKLVTVVSPHSLYSIGAHLYYARAGSLYKYEPGLSASVLKAGVSDYPICYRTINNQTFFGNRVFAGKIVGGVFKEWGVEQPSTNPLLSASTSGGLFAGTYRVACTFETVDGEESGAPLFPSVQVAAGGGINVVLPTPTSPEVAYIRVYVTEANSTTFYLYARYAVGTTTCKIVKAAEHGRALKTALNNRFTGAECLAYAQGRLFASVDNNVSYSLPLNYGLRLGTDFMLFPTRVTVLMGVQDGIYVCADKTYFVQNPGTPQEQMTVVLPYGGVFGTGVDLPDNVGVSWFSHRGFVTAYPGGKVENKSEERVSVDKYERGAMILREREGARQMVTSLNSSDASAFSASGYMEAEVIRMRS